MKILGLDPGYKYIGLSLLETGGKLCRATCFIALDKEKEQDRQLRFAKLFEEFLPDEPVKMYHETIPPFLEIHGQKLLGKQAYIQRMLGIAQVAVLVHGGSYFGTSARAVKKFVTGDSLAEKKEVQRVLLETVEGLDPEQRPDYFDAVGLALYGLNKEEGNNAK